VFKDLIVSHTDHVGPVFVSDDGVVFPLRFSNLIEDPAAGRKTPRYRDSRQVDVKRKRVQSFIQSGLKTSFQINSENVKVLIRLADKFDIEYLMNEIKVVSPHVSLIATSVF